MSDDGKFVYPDWWKAGVQVVGNDGTLGTIVRGSGGWSVEFSASFTGSGVPIRRYMPGPNPRDWNLQPCLKLSEIQINQVTHDADRAFLTSIGRGIRGSEWASVPESQREGTVYAAPLAGDGYEGVRKAIADAIRGVLNLYL